MKKLIFSKIIAVTSIATLLFAGCQSPKNNTYLGVNISRIENQLDSLLNNYYPRIIDTIHGGYWTNFENDWTMSKDQDKMLVTQARGLWTASRAAELFPDNPVFRRAADHGYQFLTQRLWDTLNGGFCQNYYIDSIQKTDPSFKLAYGNAFALFGLAQYARINRDPEVLSWVKKAFDWLNVTLYDPEFKGYFNIAMPRLPADKKADSHKVIERAGWGNPAWKDQNTSIHLLEAFTAVYRVLPDELVKARLSEMLSLVRDTMTAQEGYLRLYFSNAWQPLSNRDSSRAYIMANPALDHISFGHNIETAYLLVDASSALYGKPDSNTLYTAKKLLDHTLKYGFDKNYYGIFDKGYRFKGENTVEVIDSTKVWWSQAEAWHALALFSGLFPEDTRYKEAFANMWKYIDKEMIDHQHGGWYNSGLDKNPETIGERKAHAWKGCYHDGRALMQVMTYAKESVK